MLALFYILPFVVPTLAATGVLLPLYVYPGTNAANWAPVTSAIAANPSIKWQIIINPFNGPNTTPANPYPVSDYIYGIEQLNGYSNVQTLGYVKTSSGNRPLSQVYADINNYTNWGTYSGGNIAMDGIFFDQVTDAFDISHPTTQYKTSNDTYYQTIANYAYAHVPSSVTPVVFNPGQLGPAEFFDYCDTMVDFESPYSSYSSPGTLTSITNSGGDLTQTSILIHDTPTSLTQATMNSLVHTMKANKVQFVYFSYDCCWNAVSATLINMLVSALVSA